MAVQNLIAGLGVSTSSNGGSIAWTNPNRITVQDANSAEATQSGTSVSEYLKASNFGFTLPVGAGVDGIVVTVRKRRTGGASGQIQDHEVRLSLEAGLSPDNKGLTTTNWQTSLYDVSYGGASDIWGFGELKWSDINNANFGCVLSFTSPAAPSNRISQVDSVIITVTYTEDVYSTFTQKVILIQ